MPPSICQRSDKIVVFHRGRNFAGLAAPLWLLLLGTLLCCHPAQGREVSVYGPAVFVRTPGAPVRQQAEVDVDNPRALYRLQLVNGRGEGGNWAQRVSGARITWNGVPVLGPQAFNQWTAQLSLPVAVKAHNLQTVELFGAPGSRVSIALWRRNHAPKARAGADQTLATGAAAALDGSASSDRDGDALMFRWELTAKPEGSQAALDDPNAPRPRFNVDRTGHYQARLIVNDGFADSRPDFVAVDTHNSAPMADAGEDQSVFVGTSVLLDGALSHDVDGNVLTYAWSLSEKPPGSAAVLIDDKLQQCRLLVDKPGHYLAQLTVNDGELDSAPDTVAIDTRNSIPVADAGLDQSVMAGDSATLDGSLSHDADGDVLSYFWSLTGKPEGSQAELQNADSVTPHLVPDLTGLYIAQLIVRDAESESEPDTAALSAQSPPVNHAPQITSTPLTAATVGQLYSYGIQAQDPDGDALSYQLNGAPAGMAIDSGGTIQWTPDAAGIYAVIVSVTDGRGGSDSQSFTIEVANTGGGALPPAPETVAPALNPSETTSLAAATAFLYSGANPIQTGVAAGTIEAKRAAVIRGKIAADDGQALSGVTVSVKGHPEFGQTLSRADGKFDLAVNGGGLLTLDYMKAGYLPLQRQVQAPWQDYLQAEDVIMIPLDSQANAIDLADTSQPFQIAQGSPQHDADGARQATVLFPQGSSAAMTLPDGSVQPLAQLTVRATEYTVGENGPQKMPGRLPPESGYTYAVELSADEAIAAGAKRIDLSKTLPVYVDNFLNFPVGETVPAGWYDRSKAAWIPSDNGRVIKILAVASGSAQVDGNGDGQADSQSQLDSLGITAEEQTQLALLYPAGKSLWRVPVRHFTPWDYNYPVGPPKNARTPPVPKSKTAPPQSCPVPGCIINAHEQTLGEEIPVAGTPFTLHYQSDRSSAYKPERSLDIPLSDAAVPGSLKSIELSVTVAGKTFRQDFPPVPNQRYRFAWDGVDAYGRKLPGSARATVAIAYRYPLQYYPAPAQFVQSFARFSNSPDTAVIGSRSTATVAIQSTWQRDLQGAAPDDEGLGGWTLSIHHRYDAQNRTLHLGNGEQRSAESVNNVAETIAGNGTAGYSGDGGPAKNAFIKFPESIAVSSGGRFILRTALTDIPTMVFAYGA